MVDADIECDLNENILGSLLPSYSKCALSASWGFCTPLGTDGMCRPLALLFLVLHSHALGAALLEGVVEDG